MLCFARLNLHAVLSDRQGEAAVLARISQRVHGNTSAFVPSLPDCSTYVTWRIDVGAACATISAVWWGRLSQGRQTGVG